MKATKEFGEYQILKRREDALSKVQDYIDSFLNPSKESYIGNTIICAALTLLSIKENDYYQYLDISTNSDYQIYLRRKKRSCFLNNYTVPLKSW